MKKKPLCVSAAHYFRYPFFFFQKTMNLMEVLLSVLKKTQERKRVEGRAREQTSYIN